VTKNSEPHLGIVLEYGEEARSPVVASSYPYRR